MSRRTCTPRSTAGGAPPSRRSPRVQPDRGAVGHPAPASTRATPMHPLAQPRGAAPGVPVPGRRPNPPHSDAVREPSIALSMLPLRVQPGCAGCRGPLRSGHRKQKAGSRPGGRGGRFSCLGSQQQQLECVYAACMPPGACGWASQACFVACAVRPRWGNAVKAASQGEVRPRHLGEPFRRKLHGSSAFFAV